MKTWPTLYKRTATGALQEWTIFSECGDYWTRFGQTGGTIQGSTPVACVGKNFGRVNETTAWQQADLEAQALWEKKLKKDYTTNKDVAAGEKSELVAGGILPMLAHKFSDQGDKLKYPCFVQPKLDGHRCIAMPGGNLWSRTRKPILGVPHITKALQKIDLNTICLDGELYNHSYHDRFEQLSSFIRQQVPKPGHEVVQYHIYDIALPNTSFRARLEWMQETLVRIPGNRDPALVMVQTKEVNNEDELMLAFEDFLAQGYEGAIARNADGLYVNKRSYDLLKIKQFDDSEFWCVAVEEGKGKMAGHAIFVCKNADGSALFRAKMKGDHLSLVKYFEHPELVVNKQVTVKYQGLTNKNGVPRFPVALRVRED